MAQLSGQRRRSLLGVRLEELVVEVQLVVKEELDVVAVRGGPVTADPGLESEAEALSSTLEPRRHAFGQYLRCQTQVLFSRSIFLAETYLKAREQGGGLPPSNCTISKTPGPHDPRTALQCRVHDCLVRRSREVDRALPRRRRRVWFTLD